MTKAVIDIPWNVRTYVRFLFSEHSVTRCGTYVWHLLGQILGSRPLAETEEY